jgi:hypothetical protein
VLRQVLLLLELDMLEELADLDIAALLQSSLERSPYQSNRHMFADILALGIHFLNSKDFDLRNNRLLLGISQTYRIVLIL